MDKMRRYMDIIKECFPEEGELPEITDIFVAEGSDWMMLNEGKWVSGRFPGNIRIDQATHMAGQGQVHGHVHDRKGRQLVVVNLDGTGSHGSKGILHPKDADALIDRGFTIRADRIVEWWVVVEDEILLG